jgi:hypothetical protein
MTGGFRSETEDFTMKALIFPAIVTRGPATELSFGQVTASREGGMILGTTYCINASARS